MKLLKLILRNFKGRTFTLDANGENIDVFGANAAGKTTLFDAFCWVMHDKDSQNKKDFAIKNLDKSGNQVHNIDHEVTAVIEIDGEENALKKVYREKWTQRRGSLSEEFTGHETSYSINGVPCSKKEYDAFVSRIANETTFKLLTNPTYFNEQLHWQDRRKILLEICGDISDGDVIADNRNLSELPSILGKRSLEDLRKIIAARKAEINREIEKIPERIDEATRALPGENDLQPLEVLQTEIKSLRKQQQAKQQEITRVESGGETAEKQKHIRVIEAELQNLRTQHRAENDDLVYAKRQKKNDITYRISDINRQIDDKRKKMQSNAKLIEEAEPKLAKLRDEWRSINDEKMNFTPDENCPSCGQSLPQEQLQAAIDKAQEIFNTSKSTRLQDNVETGRGIKANVIRFQEENQTLAHEIGVLDDQRVVLENTAAEIQAEIDNMGSIKPVEDKPEYQKLHSEMSIILRQIEDINRDKQAVLRGLQIDADLYSRDIAARERGIVQHEQRQKGLERIKELEAQQKALGAEFEKLEGQYYLTEQFIQTKVKMLEGRINSRFKMARFKLFDVQVNGGLAECCETTYDGVPYGSGLNNGHKILAGLDIIRTLCEHYKFTAPIFVDNAESITEPIEMDTQVIRLIAHKPDKVLRVERADNTYREAV